MKRLLAYLFMVLGLGLTFNVNAATNPCITFASYDNSFNKTSSSVDSSAKVYFPKRTYYTLVGINCVTSLQDQINFLEEFLEDFRSDYAFEKLLGAFKAYKPYGSDPELFISLAIENDQYYKKYSNVLKKNGYRRNEQSLKNARRYIAEYKKKITKKFTIAGKELNQENESNLDKFVRIRFCKRDYKSLGDGWTTLDYKVIPFSTQCRDQWDGHETWKGKKVIFQISYDEWSKSDKGFSKDPGPLHICYRPSAKKIKTNTDKEHVTTVLFGKNCISEPRKFYKIRYVEDAGKNNNTAIFSYENTQIAKAELSQTENITVSNNDFLNCVSNNLRNLEKIFWNNNSVGPSNFGRLLKNIKSDLSKLNQNEVKNKDLYNNLNKDYDLIHRIFYGGGKIKKNFVGDKIYNRDCDKVLIAKAEPSQTQKVANKNTNTAFIYLKPTDVINFGFRIEIADLEILFLDNGKCKVDISLFYIFENYNKINNCFWETVEDDEKISVEYDFYGVKRKYIFYKDKVNNVGDILAYRPPKNRPYKIYPLDKSYPMQLALKFNVTSFINNNKTQIAKATTSEKPKKNILYKFCVAKAQQWYWTSITLGKCEDDTEVSIEEFIKVRLTRVTGSEPDNRSVDQRFFEELERLIKEFKVYKISENIVYDTIDKDRLLSSINKNKSKVKVAKVEEPKQEEFKPENKDIDNDAPVIEIAQNITVDSQAYTLKGKVKDKSQIYLTIDGRRVQVKEGNFELERFNIDPDVAEEVKIVAIDKWNNRAEKTIKVTIDLKSTDTAKVYENLNPNNVKAKIDNNKIAIIIGIEKYENLTNLDAKYANRDAKAFRAYATRALGIKPSNIKMLIDDKAKRGNTLEAFKIWLPKIAGKGGKDIHIFFAGHGLASENGKDLYVLPQDGNAKLLDDTAITRLELISLIQKVNPKSVTMFFDTCYSGQTRDEKMLVASLLRPIQIITEEQDTPDNFTIFSASDYDQVSGGIEEAQHGMFSYYLMKGLEGNADENKDKKITNGELIAYLNKMFLRKHSSKRSKIRC